MKNKNKTNALLIPLVLLVSSCAYYDEKNPPYPSLVPATITWEIVSTEFFQPRCAICHGDGGDGVNVSDYNAVFSSKSRILEAVTGRKNMPPDSALTPYELKLITNWINAGAQY